MIKRMMDKNCFAKKYNIGSTEYWLGKTELRCVGTAKNKVEKIFKLNELDPNYELNTHIPLRYVASLILYCSLLLIFSALVLAGYAKFNAAQEPRLLCSLLAVGLFAYLIKKNYSNSWYFSHLFSSEYIEIKNSNKNKQVIKEFIDELVQAIRESEKSPMHIVFLLGQYGLVTDNEYRQLVAKIAKKQTNHNSQIVSFTQGSAQ